MGKSKNTAGLLALFGGVFGLHKFYLDDAGSGIFYSFFSMMTWKFFLPFGAILGVLDAIRLFSMSTEKFDRKYNKSGSRRRVTRKRATQSRRQKDMAQQRSRYKYEETRSRKRSNPFRKSADEKFKEFDLEGALDDYKKAEEISAPDKNVHFNKACIYSLLENKEKSFYHLQKAVELGLKNPEKIDTVDELAYLRIQPEFDKFKANGFNMSLPKGLKQHTGDLLEDDVLLSQLNKLKELRTKGLLSEKEFSYEREKLLRKG